MRTGKAMCGDQQLEIRPKAEHEPDTNQGNINESGKNSVSNP